MDIRQTFLSDIPKEISKLRKLRHLLAEKISSIAVKDGLGDMTSLQKLPLLEIEDDGVVIRELGNLKQLRGLVIIITNVKGELGNALCSSINEMQLLEKLHIDTTDKNEVIELQFMSTPSALRKEALPQWEVKEVAN